MVYKTIVPIPVSGGIGSVTVPARNAPGRFPWCVLNGECIQAGMIAPASTTPTGSTYVYDDTNFVPVSGSFKSAGAWNWNGDAGFVGDMTVNILSDTDGLYAMVFIFKDGKPQQ